MTLRTQTVGQAIVEALVACDVKVVCGMPGGGTNLDVLDALPGSEIPFLLTHAESPGLMLAATIGDLSRSIGAAVSTLGPGVANAVNGIATAWLDRLPVVFISDWLGESTARFTNRQSLDHPGMLWPITKASYRPGPSQLAEIVTAAGRLAMTPPRGPVHVDVAADASAIPIPEAQEWVNEASESELVAAAEAINRSHRPAIIAGLEVRCAESRSLLSLAEQIGSPVMTTYRGKGAIDERHPLAAGLFTNALIERELLDDADLIITVGLDSVELLAKPWPYSATVVAVGEAAVTDRHIPRSVTISGQISAILKTLRALVQPRADAAWTGRAAGFAVDVRQRLEKALSTDGNGLSPARVVKIARDAAPEDTIAVSDSGAHMFPASYYWLAATPRGYLCSSGLATMGYAIPGALAAAVQSRDAPVISFIGDGGMLMNVGELSTVGKLGARVITIVFDDRSLSLIRLKQQQRRLSGDDLGLREVDWCAVATGFGIPAYRVETELEYERALGAALTAGGPSLISAATYPGGYGNASTLLRG